MYNFFKFKGIFLKTYLEFISHFYDNPAWIFISSCFIFVITILYSYRFRIVKLKDNKIMNIYYSRYLIYILNLFFVTIIISIFILQPKIEQVNKINNEISFYKKHQKFLSKDLKKCVSKTNILNKEREVLKEECKTKNFKNLQNIENKANIQIAQYKNTALVFLLISLLILKLTDKKANVIEEFNDKKFIIILVILMIFSLFSNMGYLYTGLFSVFFIGFAFFNNFERFIGQNKSGLILSILNHFKLISQNYSYKSIIQKDLNFYFIHKVDSIKTKIENIETGKVSNILTYSLFEYKNTNLFLKDESKNKIFFHFSINKNHIKEKDKVFHYLEKLIKGKIKTNNFKIKEISCEEDIYKFIFIFENFDNKNIIEKYFKDRFYKISFPKDLYSKYNIKSKFNDKHPNFIFENEYYILNENEEYFCFYSLTGNKHYFFNDLINYDKNIYIAVLSYIAKNKQHIRLSDFESYIAEELDLNIKKIDLKNFITNLYNNKYFECKITDKFDPNILNNPKLTKKGQFFLEKI